MVQWISSEPDVSNYPSSIDDSTTLPNPASGQFTNNPDHAVLHSTENDAIKAVETKLGTGASTATSNTVLRGTGTGTTAFAQVNLGTDISGLGTGVGSFLATPTSANLATALTDETGTGSAVFASGPTLVAPALGTPASGVATNLTGTASALTAGNVTTNANLTGDVTSTGNATTIGNAKVGPSKLATGAAAVFVTTSETTTSTTYADLTTTTDTVTVTIGANGVALVAIYAWFSNSTTVSSVYVSFAISGATTQAAADSMALFMTDPGANVNFGMGSTFLVTGLTAGSTTFKMKYRVNANTGTFQFRRISVVPL